ncbi:hypothetical protein KZO85_03885 [Chromohalobacter canadensis]|uniref:type IV pilus assembly protein FimV n=1 Tax=Chromohalobacter canadensis TaxID=141389 RepID=UPI0021C04D3E|nr:hypothetical protein [Chromohalobacter canadensis]MCT8467713.1 hypothetical protein [Chromohalobacter canadensis]MCT8470539.1 hypothetical protein [Chromohalobacter canadensis]MCT8498210.1 hypothetical protein [Chromohalobacter canadensis]
MLRKIALALCLAVMSPVALGVSVGAPQVTSYLNQPLRAELTLSGVSDVDPQRLKVRLADDAAFEAAGLDKRALEMPLDVDLSSDATPPRVTISSQAPVGRAYLELLLEVSWPQGRIQQPVTLLLDPPGYALASSSTASQTAQGTSTRQTNASPSSPATSQSQSETPQGVVGTVRESAEPSPPASADTSSVQRAGEADARRAGELEAALQALRLRVAYVEQERDALADRLEALSALPPVDVTGVAALLAQTAPDTSSAASGERAASSSEEAPPSTAEGDEASSSWLGPWQVGLLIVLAALLALWGWQRWRTGREVTYQDMAARLGTTQSSAKARPILSDDDVPETATIDEADIYIAYGRYTQARDWLQARLAVQENAELRLKLLSVLGELGELTALEREAECFSPAVSDETHREAEALVTHYRQVGAKQAANAPHESVASSPEVDSLFEGVSGAADNAKSETPHDEPDEGGVTPAARPDEEAAPLEFDPPEVPEAPTRLDYQLPEVEPSAGTEPYAESRESSHDVARWEVEEVAFAPSHLDNGRAAEAPADALEKARGLLATEGETTQVKALLQVAARAEDDGVAREAKALMREYGSV